MSRKADGRSFSESRVRENFTHGLTRGFWGDNLKPATYSTIRLKLNKCFIIIASSFLLMQ